MDLTNGKTMWYNKNWTHRDQVGLLEQYSKGVVMQETNTKLIAPTPHYPNWRYYCTVGRHAWEMEDRLKDYRALCQQHRLDLSNSLLEVD